MLTKDGESWVALISPSSRGVTASGLSFAPGARFNLMPGMELHVGEVQLTFLDADAFLARVFKNAKG
jgi:hypothetical protein